MAGAAVRVLNSAYKAVSGKNGAFSLGYHAGEFTVAVERVGYFPKGVTLKLAGSSAYPMGDISLTPFPRIADMYGASLADVGVTVTDATGTEVQRSTDTSGHFALPYAAGSVTVSAAKPGFRKRVLDVDFDKAPPIKAAAWVLPPDPPGLFAGTTRIDKSSFSFVKKPMEGLMIPAYYDGKYSVATAGTAITAADSLAFYWAPEYGQTLGQNVFESKGGAYLFRVAEGGLFAVYDRGKISAGERVPVRTATVVNSTDAEFEGLVQEKVQVFAFKAALAPGRYVFFQGGGNSMDNEPHPDASLGCFPFTVVAQ